MAVGAAWVVAALLGVLFYGRAAMPRAPFSHHALAAVLLFASSAMIGHMFARVGPVTLAAKPWLYFMMSGGLALMFVAPAIVITCVRRGEPLRPSLLDAGYFVVAYLAMGATFLLLA